MGADGGLADTRVSYDAVAASYAVQVAAALAAAPYLRGALAVLADRVRAAGGGGPVADVGCGPGHVSAHLHQLGVDAFGIDLSPAMIGIARRDHPALRFETVHSRRKSSLRRGGSGGGALVAVPVPLASLTPRQ